MALSGVEIFKLLPKTNCKKCGFPTCLAFAMKLAQRQASLDACPDVSEEAKRILGEASAPPIKAIAIGKGEKAVKLGEETVLFRHEKKFVNPCAFALSIKDTLSSEEIKNKVKAVLDSEIERVGQRLRADMILVDNESGDSGKFESAVKQIVQDAPNIPLILKSQNPSNIEIAIKYCSDKRPLIYTATNDNYEVMAKIARDNNAVLCVYAEGTEALSSLAEKVKSTGMDDIILDSGARKAKDMLEHYTQIRRAAIKKSFKPLGYPVISFAEREDPMHEIALASIGVTKYASIIVLSSIEKWKMLALLTQRQNIYTDPQVPMQVEQKIYKVGEPTQKSPLLITTNFSLTYFIVQGEVENSKVPSWLAVMDVEGLSVLTAWAAGKFTASKISEFIKESGVEKNIAHKELIIPGYVAILSGALEDKLEGWKITVGPREANALPSFLKARTTN
jgi:acetyl-CoA decarbonylase/synthase complex subunit gamma